jgi:UDP-N-acetylglucosamine 4,6-dehydratase
MSSPLHLKSILITGGAGAFGRAFVRRALEDGASRVAILSRDEVKHASFRAELNDDRTRFLSGDVRNYDRLVEAMRGVEIVVHAAAMKRIENCESDPAEAVATNVDGTLNVARAAIAAGVEKAVLTSTDKAASPNTLYGATKLCAERIWNASNVYSAGTPTRFASTRYGNVLGSTGSVVPTWRKQRGTGTITVTDRRMTRFFMSMDDAVDLVVLALEKMRGGEVFVPKLKRAEITSLAKAVAPECEIREVGIRPGEKIHETLISDDEARQTWDCGSHYVIEPAERTWGNVHPLRGRPVETGFRYDSATAPLFSIKELEEMIA